MRVENSFLGAEGIGETIEKRLWKQGVIHWEQFDCDCKGVGPTRASAIETFIENGTRAIDGDDPTYFGQVFPTGSRWRLYETFSEQACFFDIETTGLDHHTSVVTTVSIHQNGTTRTLVRGDDLTAEELRATLGEAGVLITFNGARFDIPFLEHCFDIGLEQPHIDLMPTCGKLGLSGGLSAIESEFGIGRSLPDVDGREAVRLWHEHERGVDGALDRLIQYNQEDTENMVPVMERAVSELDRQLLPEECSLGD